MAGFVWLTSFPRSVVLLVVVSLHAVLASNDSSRAVCSTASESRFRDSICSLSPGLNTLSEDGESQEEGMWEVKLSPGRGRGVFAVQKIERGTLLLVEEPLLAVKLPALIPGKGYDLASMTDDLVRKYSGLTAREKMEFDACHEHQFQGDSRDEAGRLMAILRSNGYTVEDSEGRGRVALYPKAALINHSCQPNVLNGDATGTRKIIATKDILPGEEIVTTYIPLLMSTQNRQDRLAQYGFTCGCHSCRTGSSDHHRVRAGHRLEELEEALTQPISAEQAGLLLRKAHDLDSYFTAEGFSDYLVRASRLAFEYANRAGNSTTARAWARKHLEYLSMVDADSVEARSFREALSSAL